MLFLPLLLLGGVAAGGGLRDAPVVADDLLYLDGTWTATCACGLAIPATVRAASPSPCLILFLFEIRRSLFVFKRFPETS